MALAYFALAWAAGLFAADRAPLIASGTWLLIGLGGTGAWFFSRDLPHWRLIFALIAGFGIAAARMASLPRTSELAALNGSGGVTIEGVVVDPPNARDISFQVRINAEQVAVTGADQPTNGLVLAQLPPAAEVRYGDRIRVTGRLRTPEEGDTFDYATYLARRGVFSLIDRVSGVEIVSRDHGSPLIAAAANLRDWVRERISAVMPEPHAGILTAVLTGDERGISPSVALAYSGSGIAHLLAVSGFNMALVGGIAMRGLERAERRRWLWLAAGLFMLFGYTALVGFSASASRAAVMAAVVLVGSALQRRAYLPVSLGFALIVLTAFDPAVIFDIGFQLSFAAVLGITLFGDPLTNRFRGLLNPEMPNSLPRATVALLVEALLVTLAASALTAPLIGLTFGSLPLTSLLANMLVVPVQPAVMLLGFLILVFSSVPVVAQALAWICLVPLAWTTAVARQIAQNPLPLTVNLHQTVVGAGFGVAIAFSLANATRPPWWMWARSRLARIAAFVGICTAAVLAAAVLASQPDGKLHVWILDVGHSHAVLIQSPSGAQILVDGGRYPSRLMTSIGDRIPFNDDTLDALIVTQPDPLEIGALAAVVRRYHVETVYTNGQPNLGAEMADIAALAPLTPVLAGQIIDAGGGTTIEILHPQTAPEISDALDDSALVLRVRYGEVSFLLAGEISREGQAALLDAGEWPLASVLILPKHGGVRSLDTDFLDAVQPSAIVIQTDRANIFGDPNPDILEILPDVPLYRTDQNGALHFISDGHDLLIETEK